MQVDSANDVISDESNVSSQDRLYRNLIWFKFSYDKSTLYCLNTTGWHGTKILINRRVNIYINERIFNARLARRLAKNRLQNFVMKLNNICGTRIRRVAFVRFIWKWRMISLAWNQKLHEIIFTMYVALHCLCYQKIKKTRSLSTIWIISN